MCMGDIDHGSDGYYRQWVEEQMANEQAKNDQANFEAQQNAQAEYDFWQGL